MVRPRKELIAVLHLPALPGAPRAHQAFQASWDQIRKEAEIYRVAGITRVIIENHGDAPFFPGTNPPQVVAAMAVIADRLGRDFDLEVGINILRNDAHSALAAAAISGAKFIRCNLLAGLAATDQGLLSGQAHDLMRYRKELGESVAVWADIDVKYSTPLYVRDLPGLARATIERSLADAVILTGGATGAAVSLHDLESVKKELSGHQVIVGSGVQAETVGEILSLADGVIVGSDLKVGGYVENPVAPERVKRFVEAFRFVS